MKIQSMEQCSSPIKYLGNEFAAQGGPFFNQLRCLGFENVHNEGATDDNTDEDRSVFRDRAVGESTVSLRRHGENRFEMTFETGDFVSSRCEGGSG